MEIISGAMRYHSLYQIITRANIDRYAIRRDYHRDRWKTLGYSIAS